MLACATPAVASKRQRSRNPRALPSSDHPQVVAVRFHPVPLIALSLFAAGVGWQVSRPAAPEPVDTVLRDDGWADEQTCADCHEQAETFWQTGHANTLQPAGTDFVIRYDVVIRQDQIAVSSRQAA